MTVIEQVLAVRYMQDMKWGGPRHDDTHTASDWSNFIAQYVGRAGWTMKSHKFREAMLNVAALAIAAIESYDRAKARDRLRKFAAKDDGMISVGGLAVELTAMEREAALKETYEAETAYRQAEDERTVK